MFILTLRDKKEQGAYAVQDGHGNHVLFLFEEEDDAVRYAMMLEDNLEQEKNMQVIEVEDDLAIKTCSMYNYKYVVITPDDLVIPPSNDKVQED